MINTLQHVGIGVKDIDNSYEFYRKHLGFRIKLSESEYDIWELESMFGRKPRMRIHNSSNPYGGPSLELFQHIDTSPMERSGTPSWADRGMLELGIEVRGLKKLYQKMESKGVNFLSEIRKLDVNSGKNWLYVYLKDQEGQLIQLLEMDDKDSIGSRKAKVRGINHVGIGVSDIERSISFYSGVLGFDKTIYRGKSEASLMSQVMPSHGELEVVILARSAGSTAQLSSFNGGMIKLIHSKNSMGSHIFEGRRFGDPGLTEIAFDVDGIHDVYKMVIENGAKPLVPPTEFDWGFGPRGALAYIEDTEGNVIELVELKSLFKLPPTVLDWLVVRPLRLLSKLNIL